MSNYRFQGSRNSLVNSKIMFDPSDQQISSWVVFFGELVICLGIGFKGALQLILEIKRFFVKNKYMCFDTKMAISIKIWGFVTQVVI